jgi:glycine cleavage system H lipoate-binding protein/ABC-type phosphate transport system substrate-binding protein
MKKLLAIICSMVLFAGIIPAGAITAENNEPQDAVKVRCSPDLQEVIAGCADAFMNANEDVKVDVGLLEEGSLNDWVAGTGQIAFVTKGYMDGLDPQSNRIVVIGRDVYVPVMNNDNPYHDLIMQQGLSPAEFAALYAAEGTPRWGSALQNSSTVPVTAYRIDDPSFIAYLTDFLHAESPEIAGSVMESCGAVVEAVKRDPNAIGFCTLTQLIEMEKAGTPLPLTMIPVDLNGNDQLDHFETIYTDVAALSRGIWIGKYTGTLYSKIFALTSASTFGAAEQELISWIISNGQEVLAENGYAPLMENEKEAILAGLVSTPAVGDQGTLAPKRASTGFLIVLALLGVLIVTIIVLTIFNRRTPLTEEGLNEEGGGLIKASGDVPGGYYFDRSHTWTFLERDGKIRVGLDNFLQKVTGKITKVDLRAPGDKVKKGETIFAMIQHGKRLEIKSPVTGTIVSQNAKLVSDPGLLSADPFNEGWICLVEPVNWVEEFGSYMKGEKYSDWIKDEFVRLKDFFASVVNPATGQKIVLQDGGEVIEGILNDLGPEVWEDFQTSFLK